MNSADKQYLDVLSELVNSPAQVQGRNGGTTSHFGKQLVFEDVGNFFPLLVSKTVHFKSIMIELLWFLKGHTNIKYLKDHGVSIWDEWRAPWTFEREQIWVDRIQFSPEPYHGNFSWAGLETECDSIDRKLAETWSKMMRRCYDPFSDNYQFYGAKGVTVGLDWHDPKTFVEQVQKIPHWYYKTNDWNNFELDKDYYGSNQYNADSCIWLHKTENVPTKAVGVKFPDGHEEWFMGLTEASTKTGLSRSSIHRFVTEGLPEILKGNNKKAAGWEFISESTNGKLLRKALIDTGELGPVYGKQWRSWPNQPDCDHPIDQITNVIKSIKEQPHGRRHIVSAWNPAEVEDMALPPCHTLFQFHVRHTGELDVQLYQRSADWFLGVPFNIASYALLLMLVAREVGRRPGKLVHTFGDYHLYDNHVEQAVEQLSRQKDEGIDWNLPQVLITALPSKSIFDIEPDDIQLMNYNPLGRIKAPVSK